MSVVVLVEHGLTGLSDNCAVLKSGSAEGYTGCCSAKRGLVCALGSLAVCFAVDLSEGEEAGVVWSEDARCGRACVGVPVLQYQ